MTNRNFSSLVGHSRWAGPGVFLASVVVIVVFWSALPPGFQQNESADYVRNYEPVARRILNGEGITKPDGSPATRYPPGFPVLLAGIFAAAEFFHVREETVISLFNLACMGGASVILFMLARRFWGTIPAIFASCLWITYPLALWFTKQPSSSVPFLIFLYGGLYLFIKASTESEKSMKLCFLAGALLGIAMLIRPIAIGAVFALAAALYVTRKEMTRVLRLSLIASMLVGTLAAIAPWEAWLYSKTGKVILLSSGAGTGMLDGLTERHSTDAEDVRKLMDDIREVRADTRNAFTATVAIVVEKLRKEPTVVMKLYAIKAARAWYGTDSGRFETHLMLVQLPYLLLIASGTVIAWKRSDAAKTLAMTVWLLTLYFWAMTTAALSIVRYMIPAIGLLFLLTPAILPKRLSPVHTALD
jgi:4-amino-4-deoxy-L-arabinose transferase-like glycosyltransferase